MHFLIAAKLNEQLWCERFGGWGHKGFSFKNPVNSKQKSQNECFFCRTNSYHKISAYILV